MTRERAIRSGEYVLVALVGLNLLFAFDSISRDAGAFLTIAQGIPEGKVPYVDYVDHKPPGIYYLLAILMHSGASIVAIKLFVFSLNQFTAGLLLYVGREEFEYPVGLLAAIFYLSGLLVYEGRFVLTEPFVAFFSVVSIIVLRKWEDSPRAIYLVLLGTAIALAAVFKQSAALLVPPFVIYLAFNDGRHLTALLKRLSLVFIGGIPLALLVFGYYHAIGHFDDILYWTVLSVHQYGSQDIVQAVLISHGLIMRFPLLWAMALAGVIVALSPRQSGGTPLLLASLFLASAVSLIFRQFPHYLIQLLPFASLLGGMVAINALNDRSVRRVLDTGMPESEYHISRIGAVAGVLLLLTAPLVLFTGGFFIATIASPVSEDVVIGTDIEEITHEDEPILVLTAQPKYYYLSDREPASSDIYYQPINTDSETPEDVLRLIRRENVRTVIIAECRPYVQPACEKIRRSFDERRTYHNVNSGSQLSYDLTVLQRESVG